MREISQIEMKSGTSRLFFFIPKFSGLPKIGQVGLDSCGIIDSWRAAEYDHKSIRVSRKNGVYRELFRIFVHR